MARDLNVRRLFYCMQIVGIDSVVPIFSRSMESIGTIQNGLPSRMAAFFVPVNGATIEQPALT